MVFHFLSLDVDRNIFICPCFNCYNLLYNHYTAPVSQVWIFLSIHGVFIFPQEYPCYLKIELPEESYYSFAVLIKLPQNLLPCTQIYRNLIHHSSLSAFHPLLQKNIWLHHEINAGNCCQKVTLDCCQFLSVTSNIYLILIEESIKLGISFPSTKSRNTLARSASKKYFFLPQSQFLVFLQVPEWFFRQIYFPLIDILPR